jgi:hypothetical protein
VEVAIFASPQSEIVFDLSVMYASSRRATFGPKKLYQNLTVKEAKQLRKALKYAIAEVGE